MKFELGSMLIGAGASLFGALLVLQFAAWAYKAGYQAGYSDSHESRPSRYEATSK